MPVLSTVFQTSNRSTRLQTNVLLVIVDEGLLTYMSSYDAITNKIKELRPSGALRFVPTAMPGDAVVREVFASREVYDVVCGQWPDNYMGSRYADFRANLDAFTRGDYMSASLDPFNKPPETDLARTDPVKKEIWSLRCVNPLARIRCFGCFGGKDLFVALTWRCREDLATNEDWEAEINRADNQWANLFGVIPQFKGNEPDEYLSRCTIV